MNRLRFLLWLLRIDVTFELRSKSTDGDRNSYGRLLGSWNNYKDAQVGLELILRAPPPGRTLMIRMVHITDSWIVVQKAVADTLMVEVPDIPAPPLVEPIDGGVRLTPPDTHPMAQSLPYPAPPGYEGQSHMCDTNGGLLMIGDTGPLVPCCSVCGQPTD
jgi:hypothetical protein